MSHTDGVRLRKDVEGERPFRRRASREREGRLRKIEKGPKVGGSLELITKKNRHLAKSYTMSKEEGEEQRRRKKEEHHH